MSNITQKRRNSNRMLEAALDYAEADYPVLPLDGKVPRVKGGYKTAATDEDQIREWWEQWPNANIGIRTGEVSGIVVLDIDPRNHGTKSLRKLVKMLNRGDRLFQTPVCRTGGQDRGAHLYFMYPGRIRLDLSDYPGIDYLSDGRHVVGPPSIHTTTDESYVWAEGRSLLDLDPLPLPVEILKLAKKRPRSPKSPFLAVGEIPKGQRNNELFRRAIAKRRQGAGEAEILEHIEGYNDRACKEPLLRTELEGIAKSAARYPVEYPFSDLGNAQRLVDAHGEDLRWCPKLNTWFKWDGSRWAQVDAEVVHSLAKAVIKGIYDRAYAEEAKVKSNFALKSQDQRSIKRMVDSAKSEPGMLVEPDVFDQDPYALNVKNGTIDLKTGELRPHDRGDMITKVCPVDFDPEAKCRWFKAFLRKIFGEDKRLIRFLQKALGYSLTGSCAEQVWFVLYGTGSNGKSTLLNTILHVMGQYALQVPADTFLQRRGDGPRDDLAKLAGTRLIVASEPSNMKRLDAGTIKSFTGEDLITCRPLYGKYFSYRPQAKLFLASNHRPGVSDDSHGFWRRIRELPFTVQIPDNEQDKNLGEKLKQEAPGILARMVRGCLAWQKTGLEPPKVVRRATQEYRSEMDLLEGFFDELKEDFTIEWGENKRIETKVLYRKFLDYCEALRVKKPMTRNMFTRKLGERGYKKLRSRIKGKRRICYTGIGRRGDSTG
ncbi:phage/plasmid primase, P4 family [Thermodesulfobacteriota bacterium]